jgi:hypothetical protein
MTVFNKDPYAEACALLTLYRAAFPEFAPECLLQEMLGRGPKWFSRWWANATPATRQIWLMDCKLIAD